VRKGIQQRLLDGAPTECLSRRVKRPILNHLRRTRFSSHNVLWEVTSCVQVTKKVNPILWNVLMVLFRFVLIVPGSEINSTRPPLINLLKCFLQYLLGYLFLSF
jgi:hypothetical protein